MRQIYHPYTAWEDYKNGMYRIIPKHERELMLEKAISFTGNAELYGEWMLRVVEKWPISCEQFLTDPHINQKAWIGHAACCLAIECPEYITRKAWKSLSQKRQDEANEKASLAILEWNKKILKRKIQLELFK